MKKLILACAIALGVATTATAENYMAVYGGYAGTSMKAKGAKAQTLNGFELGYLYGLSLGEESPMAVEFGGSLGYETYSKFNFETNQFNIKVPVNFTYKFDLSETFAIAPYAGINFRFNPSFKSKIKGFDFDDDDDSRAWDDDDDDWFDDDDNDGYESYNGTKYNKFQMGWQIGAKAYYKNFFVYGQWGTDFIKPVKHAKINSREFSVGVGYKF